MISCAKRGITALYRHMDSTTQTLFRGLQDCLKQEEVVKEDEARRMDSER